MVVIVVMMGDAAGRCPPDERAAHDGYKSAGYRSEPELDRRAECRMRGLVVPDDHAQNDDQRGMRDGDDGGKGYRMAIGAVLADQVGRNDSLGMAGHEGVNGPPGE